MKFQRGLKTRWDWQGRYLWVDIDVSEVAVYGASQMCPAHALFSEPARQSRLQVEACKEERITAALNKFIQFLSLSLFIPHQEVGSKVAEMAFTP